MSGDPQEPNDYTDDEDKVSITGRHQLVEDESASEHPDNIPDEPTEGFCELCAERVGPVIAAGLRDGHLDDCPKHPSNVVTVVTNKR